jgi:prepilin-type N-terminal cleavage/methylation domain-containing protein
MNKQGFTLVELTVSLALVVLFALFGFGFCTKSFYDARILAQLSACAVKNALAIDYVFRDALLAELPSTVQALPANTFKVITLDGARKPCSYWVEYAVVDGKVRRVEGQYTIATGKWMGRTTSYCDALLTFLTIKQDEQNRKALRITYGWRDPQADAERQASIVVRSRNRVL